MNSPQHYHMPVPDGEYGALTIDQGGRVAMISFRDANKELQLVACHMPMGMRVVWWSERDDGEPLSMPHPDWSQAPKWAIWWAVDPDGYCNWFDNEPILTEHTSNRDIIGPRWSYYGRRTALYDAVNIPLGIDWRTLKQHRLQREPA